MTWSMVGNVGIVVPDLRHKLSPGAPNLSSSTWATSRKTVRFDPPPTALARARSRHDHEFPGLMCVLEGRDGELIHLA